MNPLPHLIVSLMLFSSSSQDPALTTAEAAAPQAELTARLVSARPKIRPGEWFPIVFVVEAADGAPIRLGPPDDGLMPLEGMEESDTRLNWITEQDDEYRLVPDLTSLQWPRVTTAESSEERWLELPLKIYVPIKAVSGATIGPADLTFRLNAMPFGGEGEAIEFEEQVTVEIVHPTSTEATDLASVDPSLFFDWFGELPDWTVQDTREQAPKKPAPFLAWMVFAVPLGVLVSALVWVFATKRL
jgi:hypothetical protein